MSKRKIFEIALVILSAVLTAATAVYEAEALPEIPEVIE